MTDLSGHAGEVVTYPTPGQRGYIGPHVRSLLRRLGGRARKRVALQAIREGEAPNPDASLRARLHQALAEAAANRNFSPMLARLFLQRARSLRTSA